MNEKNVWPESFQAAAMLTVELDAEYIWLSMDPTNSQRPKTLSMGTYGMLRGLDRVLEALARENRRATFFVPGRVAETYAGQVRQVAVCGHEIALHGYAHENFGLLDEAGQREALRRGVGALEDAVGVHPTGFRLPEGNMTPDTLRILQEEGFDYDSSLLDSDIPYILQEEGWERSLVEIPMHWEMQDFPYFAFNYHPPVPAGCPRIARYTDVLDIWTGEMEGYAREGLCFVWKGDPQSIGTPGRIVLLERLLERMRGKNFWFATGSEIARRQREQEQG